MMSGAVGWFSDISDEAAGDYQWQPCLETGTGHIPCFDVWFRTKAECDAYIRETLLPIGGLMIPD